MFDARVPTREAHRGWIGSVTTIERAVSMESTSGPQPCRNRAADGYPERLRMAALEFRLSETLGNGEARMESEEGMAFESLPRREPCRDPADQPFLLQLRIRIFMCRWCFRCVLLRAKETLKARKVGQRAIADGSVNFRRTSNHCSPSY